MVSQPTPLEELRDPLFEEKKLRIFVKRDDLIHPEIMGNKWRKLKYNLITAKNQGKDRVLTLGGAFSNHIYATAAAGAEFGFKTKGIIRGEELHADSNATLKFAKSKGMEFEFVDRATFKSFRNDPKPLLKQHSNYYFLPEGGTNELALKGVAELLNEISEDFDMIVCPIGTGGTFCGLLSGVKQHQHVLGVSALKGGFIHKEIKNRLKAFDITNSNYSINAEYHFGGYGKGNDELIAFINGFKQKFRIPLDPIYTGKCFFGVWNMIRCGILKKNLKIILLHTGGLQGISGFNRKKGDLIK